MNTIISNLLVLEKKNIVVGIITYENLKKNGSLINGKYGNYRKKTVIYDFTKKAFN